MGRIAVSGLATPGQNPNGKVVDNPRSVHPIAYDVPLEVGMNG